MRGFPLFEVNPELLIDHAWGDEPCTMADIKAYQPSSRSIGSGLVLHSPYEVEKARLVVKEMVGSLVLDLVGKRLVAEAGRTGTETVPERMQETGCHPEDS